MNMGFVKVECVEPNECSDLLMLGVHSMCPMKTWDQMEKLEIISISYDLNITNSPFGGASWSWMLPSNNSSSYGRSKNPPNIVDLLDFSTCPLMNFTGNEALCLVHVCHPRW